VAGCPGINGRIKSQWVAGYFRNHWPDDPGISTKEHAEKAQSDEGMDTDRTMKGSFRDKLLSREG